jgi:hypothetical protein
MLPSMYLPLGLLVVAYLLGGINHLPRELEIYLTEEHPTAVKDVPMPDLGGGSLLIMRFLFWPFRLHIKSPKGDIPPW